MADLDDLNKRPASFFPRYLEDGSHPSASHLLPAGLLRKGRRLLSLVPRGPVGRAEHRGAFQVPFVGTSEELSKRDPKAP